MGLAMAVRFRPPSAAAPAALAAPCARRARPRRAAGGAPPLGDRAEGARRRRDPKEHRVGEGGDGESAIRHNSAQFLRNSPTPALPSAGKLVGGARADRVRDEGVQSDAKREQDTLNRRQKDYSISLKNLKRAEQQLVNTQSLVPFMKRQIEDASRQVAVLKEEGKRQVAAAEEVRREVDVFINNFLKQEGLEAEKAEWVRAVVDEVKSLEEEVVEVAKEERDQRKIVAQLNEEREIEARKAASMHGASGERGAQGQRAHHHGSEARRRDAREAARVRSCTTSSRPTAMAPSTRSSRRRRRSLR